MRRVSPAAMAISAAVSKARGVFAAISTARDVFSAVSTPAASDADYSSLPQVELIGADSTGKGAAGQAIQNMNIIFDLPETTGLMIPPMYP